MKKIWVSALFTGLIIVISSPAYAETLKEAVSELLSTHNRIVAAKADLATAKEHVSVTKGRWFPTASATAYYGRQHTDLPAGDSMWLDAEEVSLEISQLLWDFGGTIADIKESKLLHARSQSTLEKTHQDMILEGVSAYLNLKRAELVLKYSQQSEANIKRQTEMEDTRVKRGMGYSTDVLQAKSQLRGAQARRIRQEGALVRAKNRSKAIFNRPSEEISSIEMLNVPFNLLPATLEEAEATALKSSPILEASDFDVQVAKERIASSRARGFFPTVNGVLESRFKDNVGGYEDYRDEQIAKVELTYNFNLGFTAVNSLNASKQNHRAAVKLDKDIKDLIIEKVRNSWINLNTAKRNAELLHDQADIVAEFLELARKEQQMGRRSLLDVLSGETVLINSQSAAAAAETDIAISALTLLNVMGKLEPNVLE